MRVEKARSPNLVESRGLMETLVKAERRPGRCEAEQHAVTTSLMYAGDLPLWTSYIRTHSL